MSGQGRVTNAIAHFWRHPGPDRPQAWGRTAGLRRPGTRSGRPRNDLDMADATAAPRHPTTPTKARFQSDPLSMDAEQGLDRCVGLQHALRADVALIRARRADALGNLVYEKTARNFNPDMATAADVVIAQVDEIVDVGKPAALAVHHAVRGRDDAPPLVLSGSLGATSAMWEPQLPALAEHFRVVTYDTRGHGASPVPPGPYALADLGADVLALLDRLGIERASFAGLSLGGMVGMWLAAHAPERIDRLALLCTSPYMPPTSQWGERAAAVRAAGTTGVVAGAVVARWLTPAFAEREPEAAARLRAMIAATPPEGYAACCEAIERMDLRPDLGAIAAPTLVVAGADDAAAPPDGHARVIAGSIAGARLEVLPDTAHLASVEQAGAVTALLLDHLRRHEPRSAAAG